MHILRRTNLQIITNYCKFLRKRIFGLHSFRQQTLLSTYWLRINLIKIFVYVFFINFAKNYIIRHQPSWKCQDITLYQEWGTSRLSFSDKKWQEALDKEGAFKVRIFPRFYSLSWQRIHNIKTYFSRIYI